ncbi:MAG: hypothetical protein K2X93_19240 [Candidatus Obscuribacterales bacterium]|nr:hypothetical protein [Candidatus Obscuribacterales bacterium]
MPESNLDPHNQNTPPGDSRSEDIPTPTGKKKSLGLKIAGALSTVLWIGGFVLPFVLPSTSRFVWLSDTLLLIGFWPLLFVYRTGWTWVVFGVLNILLGFGLELVHWLMLSIPDTFWTPDKAAFKPMFEGMAEHIRVMHPFLPWMLIGAVSAVYGVFRIVKTIIIWLFKRYKKSRAAGQIW